MEMTVVILKANEEKGLQTLERKKGFFFYISKTSHDEDHCWKLHLELKPEKYKTKDKTKEKEKNCSNC